MYGSDSQDIHATAEITQWADTLVGLNATIDLSKAYPKEMESAERVFSMNWANSLRVVDTLVPKTGLNSLNASWMLHTASKVEIRNPTEATMFAQTASGNQSISLKIETGCSDASLRTYALSLPSPQRSASGISVLRLDVPNIVKCPNVEAYFTWD